MDLDLVVDLEVDQVVDLVEDLEVVDLLDQVSNSKKVDHTNVENMELLNMN